MNPRSSFLLTAALLVVACSSPPPHFASASTSGEVPFAGIWTPNGRPICTVAGDQSGPVIIPDGSGGAIVAWVDGRSGAGTDIYASRILADGQLAPGWVEGGMPACTETGNQTAVVIAGDGKGGAFIGWLDGRVCGPCTRIYIQRLDGGGLPAPGWPAGGIPALPDTAPSSVSIASDYSGGVLVAWLEYHGGPDRAYAQRLTSAGVPASGWPAGGLPLSDPSSVGDYAVSIVPDGSEGAYVDLSYSLQYCYDYYCSLRGAIGLARIADGLVVWRTSRWDVITQGPFRSLFREDGVGGCFWGQSRLSTACPGRYGTEGDYLWPRQCHAGFGGFPRIFADGTGGALVAGATSGNIVALRLTPEGHVAPGWSAAGNVICGATGDQSLPQAVADQTGGAYFVWLDSRAGTSDLYASRWDGDGTRNPEWALDGNPIADGPGERVGFLTVIATDALGGALVVWPDTRNGDADIYAQRITADAPTPVLASLVRAEAAPDRVFLEGLIPWAAAQAEVWRRGPTGGWRTLARATPDGAGRVIYEDREVVRGGRYGYRLAITSAGTEGFSEETWIDVPWETALALGRVRPNPSNGDILVSLALDGSGPAQLELLDGGGRKVGTMAIEDPRPGTRLVRLDGVTGIPPGIYVLRLTQGGRSLSTKVGVVR